MRQGLRSNVAEGMRVSEECQNVMKGGRDEARVFVYIRERERRLFAMGSHIVTPLVLTLRIQIGCKCVFDSVAE